jgi:hypothetical protein
VSAIDQLEQVLRDAAVRRGGAQVSKRGRGWRFTLVVVGATLLAAGAAFAATKLISIGAPVPASKQELAAIKPAPRAC